MPQVQRIEPPEQIEWLRGWDRQVDAARQESYVRSELDRLAAGGAPLLTASLNTPLPDQQDIALRVLRELRQTVFLRLRPGAVPPIRDPQGRELKDPDRGKVLVAKVGVVGNVHPSQIKAADDSGKSREWLSSSRAALARTKVGLYNTKRVTSQPQPFLIDDAITIMRAWGVGMREQQVRSGAPLRPKMQDGINVNEGLLDEQDCWLVEEVPQDEDGRPLLAPEPPAVTPSKNTKAA